MINKKLTTIDPNQMDANPVEVSGWDEHGNFFVERVQVNWNCEAGDKLRMRLPLRWAVSPEAILFIRAFSWRFSSNDTPAPYRVVSVEPVAHKSQWELCIAPSQSRRKEPIGNERASNSSEGLGSSPKPRESSAESELEEVLHEA